jgi:hypothetical protein
MAREPEHKPTTPPAPSRRDPATTTPPDEQPVRDTTHGHPGLPPKNYEAPKESRR